MVVPWRVEMRAVVGRELDALDRPSLSLRQVLLLQSRKEGKNLRHALLVVDILDLRAVPWRVSRHIVLQRHGNVDQAAGHSCSPLEMMRRRFKPGAGRCCGERQYGRTRAQ